MKRIISVITAIALIAICISGCGLFGSKAEKLTLDQTELSLTVGESAKLDAGDAAKLKWTSDNEDVATVHAGTVSAKAAGTANITVSSEDGSSQVCAVTVTDKLITAITLGSSSIRLGLGKTIQLSASFTPADASDPTLKWSSQDENIALVDEKGFVTGQSAGTTNIICSSNNGVTASCAVSVEEAPEAPTKPAYTEPPTSATEATSATKGKETETEAISHRSDDYLFPDSSTRMLSESEVSATFASASGAPVSGSYSQDAINEIFARHGYTFRTASIMAYYQSKSWYHPDPNFSMSSLSEIEEYNINLFSKY